MRTSLKIFFAVLLAVGMVGAYFAYPWLRTRSARTVRLFEFLDDPAAHSNWMVRSGEKCGQAPFIFPSNAYIGFIWGDSFRPGHTHTGLDMFGGEAPGITPVVAAASGFLTRLESWKSSVIIRIPSDPLQPDRQIWTYYTHMADKDGNSFIAAEFPPGTSEVFVEAGTLLGYQGNYAGSSLTPTGVHLHFSIVLDEGPSPEYPLGWFRNEIEVQNTLDPSPYFGMQLNAAENPADIAVCNEGTPGRNLE